MHPLTMCTAIGIAFVSWSPIDCSTETNDIGRRCTEFTAVGQKPEATVQ